LKNLKDISICHFQMF